MPKMTMMEEFHLSLLASTKLPDREYLAIQRTLRSERFQIRLCNAVRDVIGHYQSLKKLRLRVSR